MMSFKGRRRCLLIGAIAVCAVVGVSRVMQRSSRLSGVVRVLSAGPVIKPFLASPGISFVQGYVRFDADLPDDIIFGLDQEFIDGVAQPRFVKGGDWMSLIGIQRSGAVWVATGTDSTMAGTPSKDRSWKVLSTGQPLKPEAWYRLRIEADFSTREFRSFSVDGPGLNKIFDLRGVKLDYPNAMPFSDRAMTYYGFAMRGRAMITKAGGRPVVYFDDLSGGTRRDEKDIEAFHDGFETSTKIENQPVTLPTIDLSRYVESSWYLERPEALFKVVGAPFAHGGHFVGVADVDLDAP